MENTNNIRVRGYYAVLAEKHNQLLGGKKQTSLQ